jgi:hypothetical protein
MPSAEEDMGLGPDPQAGADWVDPKMEVAQQYRSMRDLPYLATPIHYSTLGSTKQRPDAFRAGVWKEYLDATGKMGAKQGVLARTLPGANVFALQKSYSKNSQAIDTHVDRLTRDAGNAGKLASGLASFEALAIANLVIFERFSKTFAPYDERHTFVYSSPRGISPIVRVALALVHLQSLGAALTADQQKYLAYCEKVFPEVNEHRESAVQGRF